MKLDAKIPGGPLAEKWDKHRFELKLVNPANKRKFEIIVVGTGLAGGSASASLAELGYNVKTFCIQDSPRRAHSIAAQGGINAAKNYTNEGDSIWRLFYDTIKGGDFRAREANVYRLAQVAIILSISVLHKAFLLHGITEDYLQTGALEAPRSKGLFMQEAKQASSFFLEHTVPLCDR